MVNSSKHGSTHAAARVIALPLFALALVVPLACVTKEPPPTTFFESNIAPIVSTSCVRSATGSGCHVADAHGNAFGNLDVTSYANVDKRRDLLDTYGPYGQPSLLIKNIVPFTVSIQAFNGTVVTVTTDIKHAGGPLLDPTGAAFQTLKQWINNGATEQNTGVPPNTLVRFPCVSTDPDMTVAPFSVSGYVAGSVNHNAQDYIDFKTNVAPYIQTTCASSNCHGTPANELYFLCGSDQAQLDWNYFVAGQYITNPPGASELLRRPLAPQAGGSFHEGGTIFQTPTDPNYQAFVTWAKEHGAATFPTASSNLVFFATRVQPMLVKKGCMMLQCHSAAMGHDYRLRGGSGGSFSYAATLKNYQLSLEQLSLESPTVDGSRIVRKNVLRPQVAATPISTPLEFNDGGGSGVDSGGSSGVDSGGAADGATSMDASKGDADATTRDGSAKADATAKDTGASGTTDAAPIADAGNGGGGAGGMPSGRLLGVLHRGGPLLEDFGSAGPTGAACDAGNYSFDDPNLNLDSVPAYCMIREWFRREQAARGLSPLRAIVYVKRPIPAAPDRPQDWDVFTGGGELHIVAASLDVNGDATLGADTKVDLTQCGLAAGADVQHPTVSWDAKNIAFAARSTASDPLAVYQMSAAGTGCTMLPFNTIPPPSAPSGCMSLPSGTLIHNFDPAYSPDERIVFASTRGNLALAQGNEDYCGPQRTPADPSKLNANLYVYDPTQSGAASLTQLTFLLNMERHPSFMDDGRVIFTTEKRAPDFYQLALRRQNLDTGDYHPLYAQRGSIGYDQADDVVHLSDKNFVAIFSQKGALYQGGNLAVFNRSLGIDFTSTSPGDYPVDPSVLNPNSLSSVEPDFFLHSLSLPDPSGTGTPGTTGNIYTSPAPLPGAKVLVSRSSAQGDPGTFNGAYDLIELDPETGASRVLIAGGGAQVVQAVAVYERAVRGPDLPPVFVSALDEPNGVEKITPGAPSIDVLFLSVPVFGSLVFQNTPTGRQVDPGITSVDFYEDMPPTPDITSLSSSSSFITTDSYGSLYVRRRLIGTAPLNPDGSGHVELPGGVPIVLHLPNTALSMQDKLPRWEREELGFAPGQQLTEMLPPAFFNNVCGQCHGAISGQQLDVAVNPDVLTQASITSARGTTAAPLGLGVATRSSTFVGPPSSP